MLTPKQRVTFARDLAKLVSKSIEEAGLGNADATLVGLELIVASNVSEMLQRAPADRKAWLNETADMHRRQLVELSEATLENYEKGKS